jgi:hypothetical protein
VIRWRCSAREGNSTRDSVFDFENAKGFTIVANANLYAVATLRMSFPVFSPLKSFSN